MGMLILCWSINIGICLQLRLFDSTVSESYYTNELPLSHVNTRAIVSLVDTQSCLLPKLRAVKRILSSVTARFPKKKKKNRARLWYILEHAEVGIESLFAHTVSLQIIERQAPIREH